MQTRCVILHGHIFKNAGSTFDWSLQRCFGEGFIDHRDNELMIAGGSDYLAGYIVNHSDVRALSSHHLPLPPPRIEGILLLPVVFIRHPVERIQSVYDFERRQGSGTLGARMASRMSFREYIEWRLRPEVPSVIRNYQTTYCTQTSLGPKVDDERLLTEEAVKFLDASSLVGVVDRYDQSIVVFEEFLKQFFPGIDLSYRKQNVGNRTSLTVDERVKKIERTLNGELMKKIYDANQCDLELYNHANSLLDSRLKSIMNCSDRLLDLKRRIVRTNRSFINGWVSRISC